MRSPWITLLMYLLILTVSACKDDGDPVANVLPPGSSPTSYSYKGYNAKGTLVIVGSFSMATTGGSEVSGTWSLACIVPGEQVGPQTGTGELAGTLEGARLTLSLNPGWADNNVYLTGSIGKDQITGTWMWSTYAGPTSQGSFEAAKRPL
jgi:hypothetical protein